MPNMIPLTEEFLQEFLEDAQALTNGDGDDPKKVGKVIAKMAHIQVHTLKNGCFLYSEHLQNPPVRFTWPMSAAVVGSVIAIVGLLIKVL